MKTILIIFLILFSFGFVAAQNTDSKSDEGVKTELSEISRLSIGGYGQIDFNLPLHEEMRHNATLDVHRMVLLFGYQFSEQTSFLTEIEMEHVSEVYVEQAYLNHRFFPWLNLKAGLMLIPMGIINEFHESSAFHGVERPNIDNRLVPTTWREIGVGFHGNILPIQTKYQVYVVNGFKSYDGGGTIRGIDGLRKGRQKGAESIASHPNVSAKVDYYGISGLTIGLSAYSGKTQSNLYNGLADDNLNALAEADSSVISLTMVGFDARYRIGGFELRGQFISTILSNTQAYNALTGKDLGSRMQGYYMEAAYNVFRHFPSYSHELIPFIRYEQYDTHAATEGSLIRNNAYNHTEITMGLDYKLTQNAVLKADYQILKAKGVEDQFQFNMGVAIAF
ncbi:MAG: hypothetical protein Q7J34_03625 [Bacteroidales bacterium]|nr:hypothetical protein [Bacteroidales bacterium]